MLKCFSNPAMHDDMPIGEIKEFWSTIRWRARIAAGRGTAEYFRAVDALREADDCEPYDFSELIHGYSKAAGLHVLDIGCGNGYVLSHYARHGAQVDGVDLTAIAIRLSEQRFRLSGLQGTFIEIDRERLPYPDATFDIVCSMGVLHHVSDPRPMVDENHRVLKPSGRLIAMLYHRYSWKNLVLMRLLFSPAYRGKSQQDAVNMNDGPNCPLALVYSRREAEALFHRFGNLRFDVNQLSWQQLFILPSLGARAARLLGPADRSSFAQLLGWTLYVRGVES